MKLKKTLSIVMAATLSMLTITGCSSATMNYSKELSNLSKWEATTSNFEGEINIEAMEQSNKIILTGTSYVKGKTQGYTELKFNDPSGKINIPELKMYIDNGISYINKGYYTSTYTSNGLSVPTGLANIQAEYIGIESGMDMSALISMTSSPDYLTNLGKTIFGDSDIDLPFVQNGREYNTNLDTNQMVDFTSRAVKGVANNLDSINTSFKLGLTNEMIKSSKDAINDPSFDTQLALASTSLAGSNITTKETFSDNNYKADINMNLQIKDIGKASVKVNSTSAKAEVKDIQMPVNKVTFTQEQFAKLMMPENATLKDESKTNVISSSLLN